MKACGLTEFVQSLQKGKCPFCKKEIGDIGQFRDLLSLREFELSGMCQKCQDETFKSEKDKEGES